METKLNNVNCKISNILLAQHFLQRAKLNSITIQNILSKVETEKEELVLRQTKDSFEILVNSVDNFNQMNTAFFGDRFSDSRYRDRNRSKSESRRGDYRRGREERRDRTRSRSIGWRDRGKSRSRSRERNFYRQESGENSYNKTKKHHHIAYKCDKFDLPDSDFIKSPEELNIFKTSCFF